MRYIGGKAKLLTNINELITDKIDSHQQMTFVDLFAGTGCVGEYFKKDYRVLANDKLFFSYLLCYSKIAINETPSFNGLKKIGIKDPLDFLNTIDHTAVSDAFILNTYSPRGGRMFFTEENAARIDAIRQQISEWKRLRHTTSLEHNYLLASLIEAVPFISNTTGTYGAYLKQWDKRAHKKLTLIHPILTDNRCDNSAFNMDAIDLAKILECDICYIDPPYNQRQYTSNYHVLETIAHYDSPEVTGVTGMRPFEKSEMSKFCRKREAKQAFSDVISATKCKHLIVSYSSDGIISHEEISEIMKSVGLRDTFDARPIQYAKYQSKLAKKPVVNEYLFYIRKF